MSMMTNQMQIQAAKLNITKSNTQISQGNNKATNSSFFDILQSMLDGNALIKSSDSVSDFSSYAKNADSLKNKTQSTANLKSGAKNINVDGNVNPKEIDGSTAIANAVSDKAKPVDSASNSIEALNSADGEDVDSIGEIIKKAIVTAAGNTGDNPQDIQIDIMLILQLLGVPPHIVQQAAGNADSENMVESIIFGLNSNAVTNLFGSASPLALAMASQGTNNSGNVNNIEFLSSLSNINNLSGLSNINIADTETVNPLNAPGNLLVDLNSASKILSNIASMANIPQEDKQIISDLAAKFADIANAGNIADTAKQNISTQELRAFIANTVRESVAAKNSANFVQAPNANVNESAARRITALLEANGIDPHILTEVEVKASQSGEVRVQDIRDILSTMKNARVNLFQSSQSSENSLNVGDNANNSTRGNILTLLSENGNINGQSQPDSQMQNSSQSQPQFLTQTASQMRQNSLAALNRTIDSNPQNTDNARSFNSDADTNEISSRLSGVINIRSSGETANISRQQNQIAEVRTHITNAANEISNMIAKNRTGGNFEMKLKLAPEGLGEVLVKVTYNKGNINLNVVTENRSAETQLLSQVETLRESLASHDFSLAGFDVGTKSDFEGNYNQRQGQDGRNYRNNLSQQPEDSGDANISQNIQQLSRLYLNRIVYKTI